MNNRANLTGYLPHSPEIREIAKGRKVARLSIATTESYQNDLGDLVTDTQYHTIVAWGTLADKVDKELRKGDALTIDGKTIHRRYTGGNGTVRQVTEIVMSDFNKHPAK